MTPFSRIAPYYDSLMSHIDYPGWVDYLVKLFRTFHREPKAIIDVACGTGNVSLLLARRGYRVIGVDRSSSMLDVLSKKTAGLGVETVCADMRRFELPTPADVAISLFDSVNYLLTEDELEQCFTSVHRNLAPHGLFIFDMNTITALSTHWGNSITVRETDTLYSIWKNTWDVRDNISTLRLILFVKDRDRYLRFDELHRERGYPTPAVEKRLKQAGFVRSFVFQHLFLTPPSSHTARIMVVAER